MTHYFRSQFMQGPNYPTYGRQKNPDKEPKNPQIPPVGIPVYTQQPSQPNQQVGMRKASDNLPTWIQNFAGKRRAEEERKNRLNTLA